MTNLSSKEKLENFWYYYRIHVIVGIGIIVLALGTWLTSRPSGPPVALNVEIIGAAFSGTQTQLDAFEKQAAVAVFGAEGAQHQGISVNTLPISGSLTSPSNADYQMSLVARISARGLDVIVSDPADYKLFLHNKFLANLKSIPSLNAIVGKVPNFDGYGLPLAGASRMKSFLLPKGAVVGIVGNTVNMNAAARFLKWLYSK